MHYAILEIDFDSKSLGSLSYHLAVVKSTRFSFDFVAIFNSGALVRRLVASYMAYSIKEIPFFVTFTTDYKLSPEGLGSGHDNK